jgi:ABC-2 type transport system permease protein
LLFRTPIYFMNCILMNFLWPVFLIVPFMADSNSQGQLKVGISFIQTNNKVGVVIAAAFAISIFISTTNLIAATAISREGKNVFTLKYMPIDFRQIIIGKTMPAIVMGVFSVLIILIMGILLIKFSVVVIIFICIVCLLGIVFTSFTGILIDLTFPKLNWDTEQKAVKQNMNGVLNMVIGIAAAAIIIFVVVKFKINMVITFAAIVILFTLINLALFNVISTYGVKKLSLLN